MGTSPSKESIYCVSDIHTDHKENWKIILSLAENKHLFDQASLICAGDISTELDVLRETLAFLKGIFAHVFFCPVRARRQATNSREIHYNTGEQRTALKQA